MATTTPASFQAITDPMIRLVQACDDTDQDLFLSALTPDAVADMTGFNDINPDGPKRFGVLKGRDAVVQGLYEHVGPTMETTHMLCNFRNTRSWTEGDNQIREVTGSTLAQHFKLGEGHDASKKGYLMGNRWRVEIVRMVGEIDEATGEDRWRIRLVVLWNSWTEGDRSAITRN